MKMLIVWSTPIILIGLLTWFRKPGKGGVVGRKIRSSDWASWNDAMHEAEERVRQLKECEPKL